MIRQASRRRDKNATRERLLQAAARVFNKSGFGGTDSNRLARAAGYAPATFYKHFADKRDCFLQVYEAWVAEEWAQLAALLAPTEGEKRSEANVARRSAAGRLARALVGTVVKMHVDWRGLRNGLRELVATDAVVRRFQRQQRRRQLELLRQLRARRGGPSRSRSEDAVLLLAMERTADALADGEIAALEVPPAAVRATLVRMVERHLSA